MSRLKGGWTTKSGFGESPKWEKGNLGEQGDGRTVEIPWPGIRKKINKGVLFRLFRGKGKLFTRGTKLENPHTEERKRQSITWGGLIGEVHLLQAREAMTLKQES